MARNQSNSPVIYEEANRELKTIKDYFANIGKPVIGIDWEEGIDVGTRIKSHQPLAQIVWDDDSPKTCISAPPKCAGRIDWKNGQIKYEWLHLQSQALLRLAAKFRGVGAARKRRMLKRKKQK